MSGECHDLEVFENGKAAFVSARELAWHRLGTVTEAAMTAEEAARLAHLAGWNVRKVPMLTENGTPIKGRVATVRNHPVTGAEDVLGVVGKGYKVIQNEDAFAFLDTLVDEGGAHFETAGAMKKGARVFMSMKMPEGIQIAGQDAHDLYLLASNSHDGTSAFTVAVTPVRVVCRNTLTMGLGSARQKWSIRHTANADGRVAEAREALQLTYKYVDAFSEELERMLDDQFSHARFEQLLDVVLPMPETEHEGWMERAEQNRSTLFDLFATAKTNDFGRGTKYAAYNAITEYADWYMPVKGEDPRGIQRAERALTGVTVQQFKDRGLVALRNA